MTALLFISSSVALALLVVHSWRTRGRFVTLAFFISAVLFGMLRGNVVWLTGWVIYGPEARVPYVISEGLIPSLGHESAQAAVGWAFALYLAWTVSELVLRRLPLFAGRVFMIAGLASLFMAAICYCMETTAVSTGWWHWTLPATSALFGHTNVASMEGWFSLVPCFFTPFLVIVCSRSPGDNPPDGLKKTVPSSLRWLWLAVYPMYALGHGIYALTPWGYPIYIALELLLVGLMMFSPLRMARGEIDPKADAGFASFLPGAALAIFFAMLIAGNIAGGAGMSGQMTLLPMLMLCLLAWPRASVPAVLTLSVAAAVLGWIWAGPRAMWALVPAGAFLFLLLLERRREPAWLRAVPLATVVALAAVAIALNIADLSRRSAYYQTWWLEDALEARGRTSEAAAAWERVERSRPCDLMAQYIAAVRMATFDGLDPHSEAVLKRRLPHAIAELEDVVNRDPLWVEPRQDLADFYLVQGRVADAVAQCREIIRLRPTDRRAPAMLDGPASLGDPSRIEFPLGLARLYLADGPAKNVDLALLHARRAVEMARASGGPRDLSSALLVLGRALLAAGDEVEARRTIEEGRDSASPDQLPDFNRLLRSSQGAPR